jgi:hypothetical protein
MLRPAFGGGHRKASRAAFLHVQQWSCGKGMRWQKSHKMLYTRTLQHFQLENNHLFGIKMYVDYIQIQI